MWFISLVLKNLWRRKIRSFLTCTTMAIAVCAVVSMLGTAEGYEHSFAALYESRGVDLVIVRAGITQRVASNLDEALGKRFATVKGVGAVEPILMDLLSFEQAQLVAVYVYGLLPDGSLQSTRRLVSGRRLTSQDQRKTIMGNMLAQNLDKKVGDTVTIEGEMFEIVGIYESFNMLESNGAVVPLPELQALMDRPNQVITFVIWLSETPDKVTAVEQVRAAIEDLRDARGRSLNLSVLTTQDHVKTNFETQALNGLAWASSTIALMIGLLSMLNTMTMSITERIREIATLRAVGWKKLRVVRMIFLESLVLALIGSLLGVLLAIPLMAFLARYSLTSAIVVSEVTPVLLAKGVGLGVLAGALGGIYPAWIASQLSPSFALRHE